MYRVKRRTAEEELSLFLCHPKSAWATSQSAKRLSWAINDTEEFKKNSYFIGVRNPLVGVSVNAEEPKEEIGEDEEDEEEWPGMMSRVLISSRLKTGPNRFCSTLTMGLVKAYTIKGMTAQDMARVK